MNALKKIFNVSFLILFYLLSVVAITTVINGCFWAGMLVFPLILLAVFLFVKHKEYKPLQVKKFVWPLLQLLSLCVMLYLAFTLEVSFSWDWGQLIRTAYAYVNGDGLSPIEYYARYPNNRFWLAVLIGLFKGVFFFVNGASIELCKKISMILSVLMVQLTIFVIYKTAQKLWSDKKALLVGCVAILCLPLYLYAQFAYTDTPAMLLIACMVYAYIHYKESAEHKSNPFLPAAVIGVLAALVYQIKIMGLIVPIAMIIDTVLSIHSWKKAKKTLITAVALIIPLVCCVFLTNAVNNKVVPISDELSEQYEFPITHWVMMGLGKSGGYDQNDVDFTKSFDTPTKKIEANVAEIKARLSDRGTLGTIKHLLITKGARTWGNDDLAGSDYTNRGTLKTDTLVYEVFTLGGHKQFVREIYTGIYHICMIIGILLSALTALKNKKDDPLLFIRIAIFGLILFMTLWECNSRYLLIASPLLLLGACNGWFDILTALRKKITKGETL